MCGIGKGEFSSPGRNDGGRMGRKGNMLWLCKSMKRRHAQESWRSRAFRLSIHMNVYSCELPKKVGVIG